MSVFKACDIRGVYGEELDDRFALGLGRAIGTKSNGGTLVVGGDVRPSTRALKSSLIDGLVRAGCDVIDIGTVATPVFYYALRHLGANGGVMVTASHNPPHYNGFKLMLGPLPVAGADLLALQRLIEAGGPYRQGDGAVEYRDVVSEYEASLVRQFEPHGMAGPVVIDAGNGCLGEIAPRVLRSLGHDVSELYCELDGTFPNRSPDPAEEANLRDLKQRVLEERASLGVAYDGDGDRVIFVDERGLALPADRLFVLFVRDRLCKWPGSTVVYDIKCSSVVAEEIERVGGAALMRKSGHAFIKRSLLEEDAVLGGENSGHYFFRELGGDDALYATLLLLDILQGARTTLGRLMKTVPRYPITPDIRLPCPPDRARAVLNELETSFRGETEISKVDGVRVSWMDGWALARISVTEPLLTLRFEARTEERLAEIRRAVSERVPPLAELLEAAPSLD